MSDFAKIVTASDGAQVLFYKDMGDDGPELVQVTEVGGTTGRIALGFDDNENGFMLRQRAFDVASIEQADQMRAIVKGALHAQ